MKNRATRCGPEILYQEVQVQPEHERMLEAAFDVLFDDVLKRRQKLSTEALSIPMTVVYN